MSTRRTLIASALGVTLLAAGSGFALAQMGPGSGHPPHGMHRAAMDHHAHPDRGAFQPGRHIEGRIAFLKAELKITDAQGPAFDKFAEALRVTAKEADARMEARRASMPKPPADGQAQPDGPKPPTALERIERQADGARFMAASSQRILDSFKPLYASLSDDQKKTADELVGRYVGPHGGPGPKMHHGPRRG